MKKNYTNPCSRCGTERIVYKVTEEKIGISIVTTSETVCPNAACQKKVNADNKKQWDKTAALKLRSEQRAIGRKAARQAEKDSKNIS